MRESFAILKGKYQYALVTIRELTQEKEALRQRMEDFIKSHETLDRNIRSLCETVFRKDIGNPDEENWSDMDLLKMVSRAQEGVENYYAGLDKQIQELNDYKSQLEKQVQDLEEAIRKQEEINSKEQKKEQEEYESAVKKLFQMIADLTMKISDGRGMETEEAARILQETQEIVKQRYENLEDIDLPLAGSVSVTVEEQDDLAETIAQSVKTMLQEEATDQAEGSGPSLKPGYQSEGSLPGRPGKGERDLREADCAGGGEAERSAEAVCELDG